MITQEELKRALQYNPLTGTFFRLERPKEDFASEQSWKVHKYCHSGKLTGCLHRLGYITISIGANQYKAHRLAFLYMTGRHPKDGIDHINGVRDDNRWCNLREASQQDNCKNISVRKNSKSGVVGVTPAGNKWTARIQTPKGCKNLGNYSTIEEAAQVRKEAEVLYGYHENHGKKTKLQEN